MPRNTAARVELVEGDPVPNEAKTYGRRAYDEGPKGLTFAGAAAGVTTAAALLTLGASAALYGVRGKVEKVEADQVEARVATAALSENVKSLAEAMRDLRAELRANRESRDGSRGGR